MDNTAIKLLQDTAIAATGKANERLPDHLTALPADFKLHDIESKLEGRTRFRGRFETASMADFVSYVKAKTGDQPPSPDGSGYIEGFIDSDNHSAKVFFNLRDIEGEPGHADWTATLNLRPTAAYRALQGVVEGKHLTQRQVIDFVEDWHRNFTNIAADGGESVTVPQAISAFRKLTIASKKDSTHVQDDRRASRSALEEIEANAGPQTPDRIYFTCVPFLGLSERTFVLRVGILTDHEDPRIVLRVIAKEDGEEAIAQEFKDVLARDLAGASSLTVGSFTP